MSEREPARANVVVVEDEPYVRESLGEVIASRGYRCRLEASAEEALATVAGTPTDLVLTDLRLGGMDGLELVRRLRDAAPGVPVVVLTGHGTIASAVECIRAGASDYILKPADPQALELAFERVLRGRALEREVEGLRRSGDDADEEPVGGSPRWLETVRTVRAAAASEAPVLLLGESGSGKEVLARLVHRLSARAAAPYVRVNCAAVPTEVWESEFFGHRRGAYTGADSDREGRFRLAHRGTLFMDEIGSMPLAAQAKILRVLQDGEFDRLGDREPTRVDVRCVAATNLDLDEAVRRGTFREDLFYRLDVIRITVPPLRERVEDVPVLAETFARRIARREGRPAPSIPAAVRDQLAAYHWPGNVRELRNVVERAVILGGGPELTLPDLPYERGGRSDATPGDLNLRAAVARRERDVLVAALKRARGVRKDAARLLGIDQRNLPYYLRKHDIDPDDLED